MCRIFCENKFYISKKVTSNLNDRITYSKHLIHIPMIHLRQMCVCGSRISFVAELIVLWRFGDDCLTVFAMCYT